MADADARWRRRGGGRRTGRRRRRREWKSHANVTQRFAGCSNASHALPAPTLEGPVHWSRVAWPATHVRIRDIYTHIRINDIHTRIRINDTYTHIRINDIHTRIRTLPNAAPRRTTRALSLGSFATRALQQGAFPGLFCCLRHRAFLLLVGDSTRYLALL